MPDAPSIEDIPEVAELDELETFVGLKKKFWLWTAVDHFRQGILAWVLADLSAEIFQPLWDIVYLWKCYFYVTDVWLLYASFVEAGDHIISKTKGRCIIEG